MAGDTLMSLIQELTRSLNDEQRKVVNEAIQQGMELLRNVSTKQGPALAEQREPADIPDLRGRWP
jgi:hypothetical protein